MAVQAATLLFVFLLTAHVWACTNPASCFANPCETTVCIGAPSTVTCTVWYCGGCFANFTSRGVHLRCNTTCATNADCQQEGICFKECTAKTGICARVPDLCPLIFEPVCGCDGETYANECVAFANGAGVASEGSCIPKTTCASNAGCLQQEFCSKNCSAASGVCMERPGGCNKMYLPVCGCDGKTYANECLAFANGTAVASNGDCRSRDTCFVDSQCSADSFCLRPKGECSGLGNCTLRSEFSACGAVLQPMCGCDGVVYENQCVMHRHAVSASHSVPTMHDSCGTLISSPVRSQGISLRANSLCFALVLAFLTVAITGNELLI